MQASLSYEFPEGYDEFKDTAEFQEHVARLFTPLKSGFAFVRTMEFIEEFEEDEDLPENMTPEMLEIARDQTFKCIDIVEEDLLLDIRLDAFHYVTKQTSERGWDATNLDKLETRLAVFCDCGMKRWYDMHFPEYKSKCSVLDEAGFAYVRSSVASALAKIPYHIEDGDEEIYYDSDLTVADDGTDVEDP